MKVLFNSIVPRWGKTYSLSLLILRSYILSKGIKADIKLKLFICEDDEEYMLEEILSEQSDVIGFSAHIWNYGIIKNLSKTIKQKRKNTFIIVGGPEITHTKENIIEQNPWFDVVVKGEGEEPLCKIFEKIQEDIFDFKDVPGVVYKEKNKIIENTPPTFNLKEQNYELNLDGLENSDIDRFFYETARGCTFRCRYCVWQYLGGVKKYPMKKVKTDLEKIFHLPKLKSFGFIDSNLFFEVERGVQILKIMNNLNQKRYKENLPQVVPHFEIRMESFTDEIIEEVAKFPKYNDSDDLFGIGLQTINPDVLKIINRKLDLDKFVENYKKLVEKGITIEIEIILGLPGDTLESYKETVDFLISKLNVNHFISYSYLVLPGSYFHEHGDEYGLVWENKPPYRLLYSDTFSKEDLHEATKLIYYLEIIYFSFRRIKKMVDQKFKRKKIEVYEKISSHFYKNYQEYFNPKSEIELMWEDIYKSQRSEFYNIRQKMIRDAREIINSF